MSNSGASRFAVGDMGILQTDTHLDTPASMQLLDGHITPHGAVHIPSFWEAGTPTMTFSEDMNSCSCLPHVYYFTRVLHALTNEAVPSFKIVRSAVRTVHDALKCIACSRSMIVSQDPTEKLRALCTLLSLIPGFYHQLLQMVDCEASLAVVENRRLAFRLEESGGLWGDLARDGACPDVKRLKDHPLDPELWRQTMRALLRTDVYGLNMHIYSGESGRLARQGRHSGLNDMVEMLDELATRGPFSHMNGWLHPESTGIPTCMNWIETAKQSVSGLIIG
ncbi:hypothetical protein ABOM_001900 [Aspergillus bombycis]|uniref:Uncharacterized protein n=1 Tax=Aspergillus bombycis TaxID=109264 RepID=A0A1F8AEC7_9EURO|nr:hypothetical protein ABOM_001900 [Aspergillus bombycis]OGM49705.1 hypothetical protein ABOM_001900 [Aspergillus bombycis]